MDQPQDRPPDAGGEGQVHGEAQLPPPLNAQLRSHLPPRDLRPGIVPRLQALRSRTYAFLNSIVTMVNVVLYIAIAYLIFMILYILSMIVLASAGIASGGNFDPFNGELLGIVIVLIGSILSLLIPLALVRLMQPGVRRWVEGMFRTRYDNSASFLYHTDFLRCVAEEDFTAIIVESVNEIPALRWISPPQPRTIEHQLEFSACYWNAVLQLSYGPGRMDRAALLNGSWTHLMSRVSPFLCCTCCCMSYYFWIISFIVMLLTCNYHLYRVARLCCIIDYVIGDPFEGR